MSFQQKINKLIYSKPWVALLIIIGVWNITLRKPETEPIWFLLGLFTLILGGYGLYKQIKLSRSNKKSPIDYLNERYEKGEITKEEYDKIKDTLKKSENS
jgi:hypothetical protein